MQHRRHIPIGTKLKLLWFNIGTIFFILLSLGGLLPVLNFVTSTNFQASFLSSSSPSVLGTIKGIEPSNVSVNDERFFIYYYDFVVDGELYIGESYQTYIELAAGDKVDVLYQESNPYVSKISGMDTSLVGPVLYTILFILFVVGALLLYRRIKKRREQILIAENGEIALAELVKKEGTSTEINGQRVYRLYFEFEFEGRKYQIKKSTHRTEYLEDEEKERVLFLADNPGNAILWDALPGTLWSFLDRNYGS
jgi:hypothetical protein